MSSMGRAAYPDWIPTGEDWFAPEATGDLAENPRRGDATGRAERRDGGTEVVGICFRSWGRIGHWPQDLVAYLVATLPR
jgi:hypothetical protein